jgi:hypothetical protein
MNIQKNFQEIVRKVLSASVGFTILFAFPASTNYGLKSYGFGGGGQDDMDSTNYSVEGILGEMSGDLDSTNYGVKGGLLFEQEAYVPAAPTFVNSGNWYNKLKITITTSNNPTDATYAVAISDDDFVTTEWVQNDGTVGANLGIEDFQTYTAWGGASGSFIIGLTPDTTYKVKVKSRHGLYSESPLGPEASAATSNAAISFDIDVASTDTESAAPYSVSLGDLAVGSVTTASDRIWIDLDTNAEYGGGVYVHNLNSGLASTSRAYTISSSSVDLSGAQEGYGVRSASAGQSSGGPLAAQSPYNGASENVGILDTTFRLLYTTSGAAITGGRGSLFVKAKASNTTPAADDYVDTITLITAGVF